MIRLRLLLILLCLSSPACAQTEKQGPPSAAEQPLVATKLELFQAMTKLQSNRWAGWPAGTKVLMRRADRKPGFPDNKNYVERDFTYVITEENSKFTRNQTVDGKVATQNLEVKHQAGLAKHTIDPDQQAKQEILNLNGTRIACDKMEFNCFEMSSDMCRMTTTTFWTAHDRPDLLLRSEFDGSRWQVVRFATRMIGKESYSCVETKKRFGIDDGFCINTEYLNASVPGHVVESVMELHAPESTADQPVIKIILREYVVEVEIPGQDGDE